MVQVHQPFSVSANYAQDGHLRLTLTSSWCCLANTNEISATTYNALAEVSKKRDMAHLWPDFDRFAS
jgi:hypothetical protein